MGDSHHSNQPIGDDISWIKTPFSVDLGATQAEYFKSTKDMLEYVLSHEFKRDQAGAGSLIKGLTKTGDKEPLPSYTASPMLVDTRLGWNDAINPLWQFNKDDDIMYPMHTVDGFHGLGRVYYETIERHQRILYLSFGVPEFTGLVDFYTKAIDAQVANLMRNGTGDLVSSITSLVGTAIGFGIKAPFLPFIWLKRLASVRQYKITKYYDFKSTMPLYYQAVTGILSKLAVNMGFITGFDMDFVPDKTMPDANKDSLPILLQVSAPDIWSIISARSTARMTLNNNMHKMTAKTSADLLLDLQQNDKELEAKHELIYGGKDNPPDDSWKKNESSDGFAAKASRFLETFVQSAAETALGGISYIGFRIDKNADASESFSNSTGESSIAQKLNSKASEARDALFTIAGGNTGVGMIDSVIKGVSSFTSSLASNISGADALLNNYTGHSYFDIPEVWESSSFGKSYGFNFALRAPYGDPISIFQSIYTPFALILAGTLPRATGEASYTSPFLLRAYCKGMFAVPLGIIESLSVQRGASEFGWNLSSLPTQIDISISIKDLSPAMYYAIGSGSPASALYDLFAQNSSFNEYMMTLSGMGLAERILFMNNMKRRFEYLFASVRNTLGNPYWWGSMVGDSTLGQAIGALVPMDALPRN